MGREEHTSAWCEFSDSFALDDRGEGGALVTCRAERKKPHEMVGVLARRLDQDVDDAVASHAKSPHNVLVGRRVVGDEHRLSRPHDSCGALADIAFQTSATNHT